MRPLASLVLRLLVTLAASFASPTLLPAPPAAQRGCGVTGRRQHPRRRCFGGPMRQAGQHARVGVRGEHDARVPELEAPAPGRYRLHDLLRRYAGELATITVPDRAAAL